MERRLGRMIRSMALSKMMHYSGSGTWPSAVDVFESEGEVVVYMDVSGVDPEKLQVTAQRDMLTVSGEREFPMLDLCCIHQLEIDYGPFQRSVTMPVPVDVEKTTSACKNGFLMVRLPKIPAARKFSVAID